MKKAIPLFFWILMINVQKTYCQLAFQDSKGETSFNIVGGSQQIVVNSAESSVTFGFAGGTNKFGLSGVKAKIAAKEGIASVVKKQSFNLDGQIGTYYGRSLTSKVHSRRPAVDARLATPANLAAFYISGDLYISRLKLLDNTRTSNPTIDKSYFSPRFKVGIYSEGSFCKNLISGIAIGTGWRDNTSDIDSKSVLTFASVSQSQAVVDKTESAYDILEYKEGVFYRDLYFDVGSQLFKRLVWALHGRIYTDTYQAPSYNPAVGIYLNQKENQPLDVVVGLQFQFVDVFSTRQPNKTVASKSLFNLVAGYTF